MKLNNKSTEMAQDVIELAQKAEKIDLGEVAKKLLLISVILLGAFAVGVIDSWMVYQNYTRTPSEKNLALIVVFCVGVLIIVALFSLYALVTSTLSYLHLKILAERSEKEEVEDEEAALISALESALPEKGQERKEFVDKLTNAQPLRRHPQLTQRVRQELVPA